MVVGICQFSLHLLGNRSLKGKRQVVRRVIERIRNRFQVAIAEVADQDLHQRATLGLAVVGNAEHHIQARLSTILAAIQDLQLANLLSPQIEILHYGREFGHSPDLGLWMALASQDRPDGDEDDDDFSEDWDLDAEEAALREYEEDDPPHPKAR